MTFGTYFAGGGVLEAGLKECGFMHESLFAVEYDKKVAEVYRENHGDHIICADVRAVDLASLPAVDWFHASPVCCRFSSANAANKATGLAKHSNDNDLDTQTATATANYIRAKRPAFVTIENVRQYLGSASLGIIEQALEECGYTYKAECFKDCELGGYTGRVRMVLMAHRGETAFPTPAKDTANVGKWFEAMRPYMEAERRTVGKHAAKKCLDAITKGKYDPARTCFVNFRNSVHFVDAYYSDGAAPTLTASSHKEPNMIHLAGEEPLAFHALKGSEPWFLIHGISNYVCANTQTAIHISGNGIPRSFVERVMIPFVRQQWSKTLTQGELF